MNAALFVETRLITGLPIVINDHLKHLPGFELIIFHGRNNKHIFKEFDCQKYEANINSLRDYNRFMTDIHLWRGLEKYNRVLVFQSDSMILRDGIEEFLQWEYIGAPWDFQHKGGNGGLSLRSPSEMVRTIERVPYNEFHGYEDVYFSNHMTGNLAPRTECLKFSCETIFHLGTFGYHAIDNWLTKEQCEQIKNQYETIYQ